MTGRWWSRWRHRAQRAPIDAPFWQQGLNEHPLARRLNTSQQSLLRRLCNEFLADKQFEPAAGARPQPLDHLLIAMQACLPLLQPGADALRQWSTVVIYPGAFGVRHQHRDPLSGVVSESIDPLVGEAWPRGPLVLSLEEMHHDLLAPWQGRNVVVHEMAHKLDMLDGPPDGVPPMPRGMSRRDWIECFQHAFDRLRDQLAQGQPVLIDPYAAENPAEYFAVTSELHFSRPALLEQAEPAVARLLTAYYGPSPAPA